MEAKLGGAEKVYAGWLRLSPGSWAGNLGSDALMLENEKAFGDLLTSLVEEEEALHKSESVAEALLDSFHKDYGKKRTV